MSARRKILGAVAAAAVATVAGTAFVPATAAPLLPSLLPLSGVAGALPALSGATDLGAAPSQVLHIGITLAYRNAAALKALTGSAHAPLSTAEFDATYGASPATIAAVTSWAKAAGLTVDSVQGNLVSISAPSATLATALGTTFHLFRSGSTTYRSVTGTVSLPSTIASAVTAISGLSSLQSMSLPTLTPKAVTGSLPTFGPQDIADYYDASTATTAAAGQTVAVIASGDLTTVKTDLRTFEAQFGLPQAPLTVTGPGSTDASGADEYDLDTQYATGEAPGAALHVYDGASLADADIATNLASWATADTEKTASFSVGGCESLSALTGFTATVDAILEKAAAQGQSLFVSSGDNGGYCSILVNTNGLPGGIPGVEYPASSTYAIGVGGTTVLNLGNLPSLYTNEIAWYAGGGGQSLFESAPAYQSSPLGLKEVPDVSLDADPTTGYTVIVAGAAETIGGTSASAPAWNGFWAQALAAKGSLGFAGPRLYAASSTFHDIVVGTNGLAVATPGFDEATGLGTPDVAKLIAAV